MTTKPRNRVERGTVISSCVPDREMSVAEFLASDPEARARYDQTFEAAAVRLGRETAAFKRALLDEFKPIVQRASQAIAAFAAVYKRR